MKRRGLQPFDPRVREALGFAGALSAVVALCGVTLQEMATRGLEAETRAFVQQSIGESSRWVADTVQEEIRVRAHTLRTLETRELKDAVRNGVLVEPTAAPEGTAVAAATIPSDETRWVAVELDPEWVAVGVWRNEGPRGFERIAVAVNSKNPDRPGALPDRLSDLSPDLQAGIRRAFEGEMSVLGDWKLDARGLLAVVVPGKTPGKAVVGWLHLAGLRRWFKPDRLIHLALVDRAGRTLMDASVTSPTGGGPSAQRNPLWQAAQGPDLLKFSQHQQSYEDVSGQLFFGGFHRVNEGKLLVLASFDAREAMSGVKGARFRSWAALGIITFGCFWVAFLADLGVLFRRGSMPSFLRRWLRVVGSEAAETAPTQVVPLGASALGSPTVVAESGVAEEPPLHSPVYLLNAGLDDLVELGERERLEELTSTVNDFFVIGRSLAKEFGARLAPGGGAGWVLYWPMHPEAPQQRLAPMRAALELRKTIAALNGARQVDGHRPLRVTMGVHCAAELVASIGEVGERRFQPLGGAFAMAFLIRQLAKRLGLDLLVSEACRQGLEDCLLGPSLGEHCLSGDAGLTQVFAVTGYRDEAGTEVQVWNEACGSLEEAQKLSGVVDPVRPSERWLVNNGSKIVGPLTRAEIASALFAQEIDFDSECWREGTGESSNIRTCGLFSGAEAVDATLWVYDGEQLHGPMSAGFLGTAVTSGAISLEHHVCSGSTVEGWITVAEWKARRATPPTFEPRGSGSPAKAA